jgi:hypothetical protein
MQNSGNVEAFLKSEIIKALNSKLLKTFFGSHASSEHYPDGLYTGLADGDFTITGAPTRSILVGMEFPLTIADRDSRAFFISEKAAKKLKLVRKETDSSFYLLDNGLINDNPAFISNDLPGGLTASGLEEPVLYANWSDLFMVQLGVASFIIDPFTKALSNAVELTVQTYWDFKFRRNGSIARGSISL